MKENKLAFFAHVYPMYKMRFSDDYSQVIIFNPFYDENITVFYYEEDEFTPFCACFSFLHTHCTDEDDVVAWINEIIFGKKFSIEFFKNEQRLFGGDIDAESLIDLTYAELEHYTGYFGLTKLLDVADSFKVKGWEQKNNFDAIFVSETDEAVLIVKNLLA